MKKAITYFIFIAFLIFGFPKLMAKDGQIHLLTQSEQSTLNAELQRISDKYDFRVLIETIDRPQDNGIHRTTEDIYAKHCGNADGVILVIATETRDWNIYAHGSRGLYIFHAPAREYIADRIMNDLSGGDLYDAYCLFAELCDEFLEKAATGTAYGQHDLPPKPLPPVAAIISVAVGGIIAYYVVMEMRNKLRSVAPKASAADYVRSGSLRVHKSHDVFLYRNVTSHRKSNGGGGRSGGSRSSGGHTSGKF